MRIFDLHCDTLSHLLRSGCSLRRNDGQLDLERGAKAEAWVQTFACFTPTAIKGKPAYRRLLDEHALLEKALREHADLVVPYRTGVKPRSDRCTALFSVEGGTVLDGRLENIALCKQFGAAFFNLVWNGDNDLAHGVYGEEKGLTPLGKEALAELERVGIIADISHLNDPGIDDVMARATRPIIASHSNARSVKDHPRNLRDDQLRYLITHQGLCGINFYEEFVAFGSEYTPDDLHRHIDHILALGGKDILAIGSDYDGASMPNWISRVECLPRLYEFLCRWYGHGLADKIFYENAMRFVEKNLCIRGS